MTTAEPAEVRVDRPVRPAAWMVRQGPRTYYVSDAEFVRSSYDSGEFVPLYPPEAIDAERERCADKVAGLAWMMENGAGECEPGERLRQAERAIRDGDPVYEWFTAATMRGPNVEVRRAKRLHGLT